MGRAEGELMNANNLILKITGALDALLRNDPSTAHTILTVMLGDAQLQRDLEDWMGGSRRAGLTSNPKRSDYPKTEPRREEEQA